MYIKQYVMDQTKGNHQIEQMAMIGILQYENDTLITKLIIRSIDFKVN